MSNKKRCLWIVITLLVSANMFGTDYCVRPDATGSNNGADWANAYTELPTFLERGSTYYLAGGDYPAHSFNDAVDGEKYINIKKAIALDHGASIGWNSSYGDNQAVFSGGATVIYFRKGFYTLDGQVGGGPGSWESGHGIRVIVSGTGYGVRIGETLTGNFKQPDNIKVRHVDIGGLSNSKKGYRLFFNWAEGKSLGPENIEISHCYIHDSLRCNLLLMYAKNVLVEHTFLGRNTNTVTHHGALFADRGSDNVIFRNNFFLDGTGTAMIDIKKNENQIHEDWLICGNIFAVSGGNPYNCAIGGNGAIGMTMKTPNYCRRFLIINNTFVNIQGLNAGIYFPSPWGKDITVYNNIWYGCRANQISVRNTTHDYNWYGNNARHRPGGILLDLDAALLASEDNALGSEISPFGDEYALLENIAGREISEVYAIDMFGNSRKDSSWTRGAVAYKRDIRGDVDGNGVVNEADFKLAYQGWLEIITLTPEQMEAADLNGDGILGYQDDVVLILSIAGGLEK